MMDAKMKAVSGGQETNFMHCDIQVKGIPRPHNRTMFPRIDNTKTKNTLNENWNKYYCIATSLAFLDPKKEIYFQESAGTNVKWKQCPKLEEVALLLYTLQHPNKGRTIRLQGGEQEVFVKKKTWPTQR